MHFPVNYVICRTHAAELGAVRGGWRRLMPRSAGEVLCRAHQNWKQFRQGYEQQGTVMSRKEKFGDCKPVQLRPMDTRKKCQNYRRGFWNDVWQRGRTNNEVGVAQMNSAQWTRGKRVKMVTGVVGYVPVNCLMELKGTSERRK